MDMASEESELRPVTAENFRLFASYLEKQIGLQFFDEQGQKTLESALKARMQARGVRSALEYYDCLIRHDPRRAELQEFVDLVANNETSFFRNMPQFEAFRYELLPRLIAAREKREQTLRIWSAGCASGEEPYSIVMVLHGTVPFPEKWRFDVRATDISQKILWAAQNGSYPERALRTMPLEYQRKYIRRTPDGRYDVRPEIRTQVNFQRRNLLEDPPPFDTPCDVIFCRNVLIYFRPEYVSKALEIFHDALADDGYLLVGHAENLTSFTRSFAPVQFGDTFVYVKGEARGLPLETPAPTEATTPAAAPAPAPALPPTPEVDPQPEASSEAAVEHSDPERITSRARHAFKGELYAEGEALLKPLLESQTKNVQAYVLMACICAATDREEEALEHVEAALDIDYLCTEAHYMMGLILQGRDENNEASLSYKRAIYSNNHFPLAHFQLARICLEQGDFRRALRCYQNAVRALDVQSEDAWDELYAGLSPVLVRRSCTMGIETCRKRLGE